jgi:hypothetical protein
VWFLPPRYAVDTCRTRGRCIETSIVLVMSRVELTVVWVELCRSEDISVIILRSCYPLLARVVSRSPKTEVGRRGHLKNA